MSIYRKILGEAIASTLATSKQSPSISEQLGKIKVGLTSHQVTALIGKPDKSRQVVSEGQVRWQWVYSATTLVRNIKGMGAAMTFAFTQGLAEKDEAHVLLYFENGRLLAVHGPNNPPDAAQ